MNSLAQLSRNPVYWLAIVILGSLMLATALLFQHVLHELPCLMCIHMRIWVILLSLTGIIGLTTVNKSGLNLFAQIGSLGVAIGMLERAWMLLGTERGFIFADCGFSLGLPGWLALEDWFPAIFRAETSCGYTPELFFGITMAEALLVVSVLLASMTASVLLSGLWLRMRG